MPTKNRSARFALAAFALAAAAGTGAALSLSVQQAEAVGPTLPTLRTLPLPTVTVPGVTTIASPTTVTTESTATVTTAVTTTLAVPAPGGRPAVPPVTTTKTTVPPPPDPTIAGARHLAGGAVSIPVSSVRAPARLRLLVSFAPHVLKQKGQRVAVALRVVDTRGYVVRGARVSVGMTFALYGATHRVGTRLSATDGLATFTAPVRLPAKRPLLVVLAIGAVDPAAPRAARASLTVRIPIRLPR